MPETVVEPVGEAEYAVIQRQIAVVAHIARGMELPGFLAAISRAEALGPILDPTFYREAMGKLRHVRELAEALNAFRTVALKELPE